MKSRKRKQVSTFTKILRSKLKTFTFKMAGERHVDYRRLFGFNGNACLTTIIIYLFIYLFIMNKQITTNA